MNRKGARLEGILLASTVITVGLFVAPVLDVNAKKDLANFLIWASKAVGSVVAVGALIALPVGIAWGVVERFKQRRSTKGEE